jgi:hypothetical protein
MGLKNSENNKLLNPNIKYMGFGLNERDKKKILDPPCLSV